MKKLILVVFIFLIALVINSESYAQQTTQPAATTQPQAILKPTMVIDNLVFVSTALNTIEISGAEVDGFLLCKNHIDGEIKKLAQEKKTPTDTATISIPLNIANATIQLLQRAKFSGANAIKYKAFVDSLYAAAKSAVPAKK